VENCRSCIFEFLSCGLYHSQKRQGESEPHTKLGRAAGIPGALRQRLRFINIFDCLDLLPLSVALTFTKVYRRPCGVATGLAF